MVQKWLKVIDKSDRKQELLWAIEKILSWKREQLDIVKMDGHKNYYRCRLGKIRILFFEDGGQYYIDKVGYRWDIYKS